MVGKAQNGTNERTKKPWISLQSRHRLGGYIVLSLFFFALSITFVILGYAALASRSSDWRPFLLLLLLAIVYPEIDKRVFGLNGRRKSWLPPLIQRIWNVFAVNFPCRIVTVDCSLDITSFSAPVPKYVTSSPTPSGAVSPVPSSSSPSSPLSTPESSSIRPRKLINTRPPKHADSTKQITQIVDSYHSNGRKCLFGIHPHGMLFFGAITLVMNFNTIFGLKQKITSLMESSIFMLPFYRELCLFLGGEPASRQSAEIAAKRGDSLAIIPGGLAEIFEGETRDECFVFLKKRFGFIRLALDLEYDLVPCFTFGETRVFRQLELFKAQRRWLTRKLHLPFFLFWGSYFLPLLPSFQPLTTVVGRPIRPEEADGIEAREALEKLELEAKEEAEKEGKSPEATFSSDSNSIRVRRLHALYIHRLQQLFDQHKDASGYKGYSLRII